MDLDNTFETTYFLVFWERGQNCYDYTIIEAYKFEITFLNSLLLNPLISQSLSFREYFNSPLTTERGRIVASSSKSYNLHNFFVFCMLNCFSYVFCALLCCIFKADRWLLREIGIAEQQRLKKEWEKDILITKFNKTSYTQNGFLHLRRTNME